MALLVFALSAIFARLVSSIVYLQVGGNLVSLTPLVIDESVVISVPFSSDLQIYSLLSHFHLLESHTESYHCFNLHSVTASELAKFPESFFRTCHYKQILQALRSPNVNNPFDFLSALSEHKLDILVERFLDSSSSQFLSAVKGSKIQHGHSALLSTESGWKVLKSVATEVLSTFDLESLDVVVSHFYRTKYQDVQDMLSTENGAAIVRECIKKFVVKLLDLPAESEWSDAHLYQFQFVSELLASVQSTASERMRICSRIRRPAAPQRPVRRKLFFNKVNMIVDDLDLFLGAARSKQNVLLALVDYLDALDHGLYMQSDVANFVLENYNPVHIPAEIWTRIAGHAQNTSLANMIRAGKLIGTLIGDTLDFGSDNAILSAIDWNLDLVCTIQDTLKHPLLEFLAYLKCGRHLRTDYPAQKLHESTKYRNIQRFIAQNLEQLPKYALPAAVFNVAPELANISAIREIVCSDPQLYLDITINTLVSEYLPSMDEHLYQIGTAVQASITANLLSTALAQCQFVYLETSMTGSMLIDLAIKMLAKPNIGLLNVLLDIGANQFLAKLRSKKYLDIIVHITKSTESVEVFYSFYQKRLKRQFNATICMDMELFREVIATFVTWPASQKPDMVIIYWQPFIELARTGSKRLQWLVPVLMEEIQKSSLVYSFDPAPLISAIKSLD